MLPGSCHADFAHCARYVVLKIEKITPTRGVTSDKHQVETGERLGCKQQPRGFLEPAPRTVSHDGIADFFGDGETKPGRIGVITRQGLQHQTVNRRLPTFCCDAQKFGAPF